MSEKKYIIDGKEVIAWITRGGKRIPIFDSEDSGRLVYRTEKSSPEYKGKAVWGDGLYLGLDEEQVADMSIDSSFDTYTLPDGIRLKEFHLEKMSNQEFNKMLKGNLLKKWALDNGFDGVKIYTGGDLNLGGDQVVIYNKKMIELLFSNKKRKQISAVDYLMGKK